MTLLTVAVPAYNVEKYIDECLGSFISGGIPEGVEVLVINDGSTDSTRERAERYEREHPDVFRVITKENGGHGSGINTGLANAKGKYFKIVDGDDMVDAKAFSEYLEVLKKCDADMVSTAFCCCDAVSMEPNEKRSPAVSGTLNEGLYAFDDISDRLFSRMHSTTWKTALLRDNGIVIDEHSFYVDMEYILFPIRYVTDVYVCELPVYKYRLGLGGQSVSLEGLRKHCGDHERVLERVLGLLDSFGADVSAQKRAYVEKGAAEMTAMQHQIYLSRRLREGTCRMSRELDARLRKSYNGVYKANRNRAVAALRASGYVLYPAASAAVRLLKK